MIATAYHDPLVHLWIGDAADLWFGPETPDPQPVGLVVLDPPYDDEAACATAATIGSYARSRRWPLLVFTDPRHHGRAIVAHGPPDWVFTWDTMNSWQTGPRRPLTQTKHALFYGVFHATTRDAGAQWLPRQNRRQNPSTVRRVDGPKSLPDIWRESLRWLHNSTTAPAGQGVGSARFTTEARTNARRHSKPEGWMRYLIATCSPGGTVIDPFAGSGTTLVAARALDRPSVGVELNPETAAYAAARLAAEAASDADAV